MTVRIIIPKAIRGAAWSHLLRHQQEVEEAAFLYATVQDNQFTIKEWDPVAPEGYSIQTGYHIELTDQTRATVIKRAHDRGACLVEVHSHLGPWPAQFSSSDLAGFREWVPHVRWRLKGQPYAAIVVAQSGFDGLAWIDKTGNHVQLHDVEADGRIEFATGLTRKTEYDAI